MATVSAATKTHPRFTREEEAALHARMLDGDSEAKDLLARSVMNWAKKVAHETAGSHVDRDELYCLAGLGIAKAMSTWNPKISSLITFATFAVRNEVMLHSLSYCGPVYVPEKAGFSAFAKQAEAGREKATSLSTSACKNDRSDLEALLFTSGDEPWERMSRQEERSNLRQRLAGALDQLGNDRAKQIVLDIHGGKSTTELGIELGISQQRVSAIHKQAIGRLREILEESECLVA